MSEWTTPADVTAQIQSLWNRGRILSASLDGSTLFPYTVRMRRPGTSAVSDQFDDVRRWVKDLEQGSKPVRGFGYEIRWVERVHRQLGRNRMPDGLDIPSEMDALSLIGKHREAVRFREIVEGTTSVFPELRDWLIRSSLVALDHAADWTSILCVIEWFRDHPRSGRYLRQVDIPGVDTKFIEKHFGILTQLLDRVLPPPAIDVAFPGAADFERRFGLRAKPPLVRFRILDDSLSVYGLSDLTVPVVEFASLALPLRRVFITENEVNGLAFPAVSESLVVFGLGYGVEALEKCEWLRNVELFYWGDIDTHGFAILDRLRGAFGHVQSFLMDRDTLQAHRGYCVREPEPFRKPLARLTFDEQALYDDLRNGRVGDQVRLEQERITFAHVEAVVRKVIGA